MTLSHYKNAFEDKEREREIYSVSRNQHIKQ